METALLIDGERVPITLRANARATRFSMSVSREGAVAVTMPHGVAPAALEKFIQDSMEWLRKRLTWFRRHKDETFLPRTRSSYLAKKEEARALVHRHLDRLNAIYRFSYGRVSIKDTRRNWGSCSELRNLNFNYKLVFLPDALAEYVVAHELCHLAVFDHSPAFWTLVAQTIPDWKTRRRALKKFHA